MPRVPDAFSVSTGSWKASPQLLTPGSYTLRSNSAKSPALLIAREVEEKFCKHKTPFTSPSPHLCVNARVIRLAVCPLCHSPVPLLSWALPGARQRQQLLRAARSQEQRQELQQGPVQFHGLEGHLAPANSLEICWSLQLQGPG